MIKAKAKNCGDPARNQASGHRLMDRILDYIALGIRSVPAY